MKLYDDPMSGNGYKARLLLAHLSRAYQYVPIDILRGESRSQEFLKKNLNGKIPVLELDDAIVPPFFAKPFGTSKSPKGAKNGGTLMPPAARVRPASAPARHYRGVPRLPQWLDAGSVALHVVSARALAQTPTTRPALPATRGSSHSLRFHVLLRRCLPESNAILSFLAQVLLTGQMNRLLRLK